MSFSSKQGTGTNVTQTMVIQNIYANSLVVKPLNLDTPSKLRKNFHNKNKNFGPNRCHQYIFNLRKRKTSIFQQKWPKISGPKVSVIGKFHRSYNWAKKNDT